MKFTRLPRIFEELKTAQDEQGGFGSTTPYSMLIEEMLKDSTSDFCLEIAEKAINIGRGKDGLRDRPETILPTPTAMRRGRKPKAQAIYGATDG